MSESEPAVDIQLSETVPAAELVERVAEEIGIPAQKAERAVEIIQQAYSGPVPLPEHVEALNRISADLGTELVRDYLAQRKHERENETLREQNTAYLAIRDLDQREFN